MKCMVSFVLFLFFLQCFFFSEEMLYLVSFLACLVIPSMSLLVDLCSTSHFLWASHIAVLSPFLLFYRWPSFWVSSSAHTTSTTMFSLVTLLCVSPLLTSLSPSIPAFVPVSLTSPSGCLPINLNSTRPKPRSSF